MRVDAQALRLEVRRRTRECEVRRLGAAHVYLQAQRLRSGRLRSAWSGLRWSSPDDDLNQVLELVV